MKNIINILHNAKIFFGIIKTKTKDINPHNHTNPFVGIDLNNYRKEICPYGLFVRYYDNNNTIRHEIYQDSTTKTFTIFNQQGNEIIYESYYKGTLQSKTYTKYNKQNKITTIQNQDPTQSQTKYSYYKNKYTQKITNNNQTTTITFNNQNKPISTLHPDKSIIYHTEKGDLLITNNFHFLDELYTDEKIYSV